MNRLAFILIFLIWLPRGAAAGEPVERIAAVVNEEIIFLSDLQRYHLFFGPVERKGVPSDDPLETLNAVIDHRLLRKEARRFVVEGPSGEEVEQRLKSIRQRFKNESDFLRALDRTGFSLDEFKGEIREQLWVERLIQERIQSFIFITPRQVEQYYQEHAGEFSGRKLDEVEPKIRKVLTEEKEAAKMKDYLARLRAQAAIQINLECRQCEGQNPGGSQ